MKYVTVFTLLLMLLQSCIPLRVAPTIEDYRITNGKKFKRSLPKREMFVFEDPKDDAHFYNYIDVKYNLNNIEVYDNVPFIVNNTQYYFSFYEIEKATKSVDIITPIITAAVNEMLNFENENKELNINRVGHWYIAIEVYSDLEKDCLADNSLSRTLVLKYLRKLKKEYLSTYNYNEVLFTN